MLSDRYVLKTLLGSGAMGRVYLAWDRKLNKDWAIKEIWPKNGSAASRESIRAEFNALRGLEHRCLPAMVDYYEEEGAIYLVMEYVRGSNLYEYVKKQGPLRGKELYDTAISLAETLLYLHKRDKPVIYRDLKPANVILRQDKSIKLIDFGASRVLGETREEGILGTAATAPPEYYEGWADERSDIYSYGKTMLFCCPGEETALRGIFEKCCCQKYSGRYRDFDEVIGEIESLREAGGQGVLPSGIRRLFLALTIGIFIFLITAAVYCGIKFPDESIRGGGNDRIQENYYASEDEEQGDGATALAQVISLQQQAGDYMSGENYSQVSLGCALGLLKEAEEILKENQEDEFLECKIENLSMLSTIYRLLGKQNEKDRKDYYELSMECIRELFEIKNVRESSLYRLKLGDFAMMKKELGESREAAESLEKWELENPDSGKEIYFLHACLLLEETGNRGSLEELYERMKKIKEVWEDNRFKQVEAQIERYIRLEKKEGR